LTKIKSKFLNYKVKFFSFYVKELVALVIIIIMEKLNNLPVAQEYNLPSDDFRMKKLGGRHCGAIEKSRGANIKVSPAWWVSVVMKIDLL